MECPPGPELLVAEAWSHQGCPPAHHPAVHPTTTECTRLLHPGQVGLSHCGWCLVSPRPKGRTVQLVVLEVALIMAEVREQGFGSYRACVKGT